MDAEPASEVFVTPDVSTGLFLAIDIGNTSIAIGVYDGETLRARFRIATDRDNLADEFAMLLVSLLRSHEIEPEEVTAAAVSSQDVSIPRTFTCSAYAVRLELRSVLSLRRSPLHCVPFSACAKPLLCDWCTELCLSSLACVS